MDPLLLRDKNLSLVLGMSPSEIQRRRAGDPSKGTPPDPDFPTSFFSGPGMRVTRFEDAVAYVRVLEKRAKKGLPVPGRRPRGRPRRTMSTTSLNSVNSA
jgi:hypothetical protein